VPTFDWHAAGVLFVHDVSVHVCVFPQEHSRKWTLYDQLNNFYLFTVSLHNTSALTKLIIMMGMALVMKCVIGNLSRKAKGRLYKSWAVVIEA